MSQHHRPHLRLPITGFVMLAELAHLTWEHFNGGVVSHHFLHRSDMPAVSNWWGLLLLPALTWFLVGRVEGRIALHAGGEGTQSMLPARVVAGFAGSFMFGILLSISFARHYDSLTSYLFQGMLLFAVLLPVYRAERVLGFILGMTFTFGAVLPTVVICVVGAGSAAIHIFLLPAVARLWNSRERTRPPSA